MTSMVAIPGRSVGAKQRELGREERGKAVEEGEGKKAAKEWVEKLVM